MIIILTLLFDTEVLTFVKHHPIQNNRLVQSESMQARNRVTNVQISGEKCLNLFCFQNSNQGFDGQKWT